jgi:uncharacterized hydrophobic protein (TIGR00271 family)
MPPAVYRDITMSRPTPDSGRDRREPRDRRSTVAALRDVSNPATIKGTIALATGVAVIVLPDISPTLVAITLGAALVAAGVYDIGFSMTGRGSRSGASRWLALLRGLASSAVGLLLLLAPQSTVTVIIVVLGYYLFVRGAISIAAGLLGRDHRSARLTIGFGSLAFGLLAIVTPASLTDGIILSGAVIAILVGAVLLAYGMRVGAPGVDRAIVDASATEILWDWVRTADVGGQRREELAGTLYFEQPSRLAKLTAWWVMLALSASIATFAILQDSTAVVIGAMLIAPLMTPILGLAGALVNGWGRRAAESSTLVLLGVAAAIALAFLISAWVPDLVPFDANSQISSRVSPTFLDMLIALLAGAAGAFATVNSRVAGSIAGVAIAVALVPPLGVVGVALENQRYDDALGALILFLTNFVSIVLAAAGVFVVAGFAESANLRARSGSILATLSPFAALAFVVLVPLVFTAEGIVASATQQKDSQAVVDDWIGEDSRLRVDRVEVEGGEVAVQVTGSGKIPPPGDLQQELSDELGTPVTVVIEFTPSVEITVDAGGRSRSSDPDVIQAG